ncbi:MAG TPA: hypothetical protein PKD09_16280 [Aggregatilinea sp.]|jgi:hypothetical protein|uniref:hypothetical protein n=1 Tax=Aggregatilinea sp. TaxID=2806333 RepID=UPI002BE3C896|nr:hypothetical protein [Aggregatilinea sp.]HML23213.1 hypothetical protein [Aggregatilinea sp.]
MTQALSSEQVTQVVENTVYVLLGRPDLLVEWHTNLVDLLKQTQTMGMEDEELFLGAVLTLLHSPADRLPTGTRYDRAWDAIMVGLQTGVAGQSTSEGITLDQLLHSVIEAVTAILTRAPDQRDEIEAELAEIQAAAMEANIPELVSWLDDVRSLMSGTPIHELGHQHEGDYAAFWQQLVQSMESQY